MIKLHRTFFSIQVLRVREERQAYITDLKGRKKTLNDLLAQTSVRRINQKTKEWRWFFDHDPCKASENNVSIVKVMSRLQTWTWPLNCRREAGGICYKHSRDFSPIVKEWWQGRNRTADAALFRAAYRSVLKSTGPIDYNELTSPENSAAGLNLLFYENSTRSQLLKKRVWVETGLGSHDTFATDFIARQFLSGDRCRDAGHFRSRCLTPFRARRMARCVFKIGSLSIAHTRDLNIQ